MLKLIVLFDISSPKLKDATAQVLSFKTKKQKQQQQTVFPVSSALLEL